MSVRFAEKEHQKQLERERKEQRKAERGELRTEQQQLKEVEATEPVKKQQAPVPILPKTKSLHEQQPSATAAALIALKHNEGLIHAAHSMNHDVSHAESVSALNT
jgi:amyloid beta A4 protein